MLLGIANMLYKSFFFFFSSCPIRQKIRRLLALSLSTTHGGRREKKLALLLVMRICLVLSFFFFLFFFFLSSRNGRDTIPLLVLGVLAADDVDVFAALSAHALQKKSHHQRLRCSFSCCPEEEDEEESFVASVPLSLGPLFVLLGFASLRTLHPSHSFLTELRTFIPRVCAAHGKLIWVALGLASESTHPLATSDDCVLNGATMVGVRRVREQRAGEARKSVRVAWANMMAGWWEEEDCRC